MEDLKNNKLVWLALGMFFASLVFFVAQKIIVRKVANQVIEILRTEYSPSPYGPGLDPDVVDTNNLWKQQRQYYEVRQRRPGEMSTMMKLSDEWRDHWERERGAR